jgi:transposase
VTIVMGLDQHRAQITAEWLDTTTGEIARKRVAPADREGVRRFAARFRGHELEVALEATTGWRFVVEEFQAIGAQVHLAEPAETAARRGTKKRAKSDRADARHLRELLMVGRLPESWIPPEHLLELRARVRLRHARRPAPRMAATHPGDALPPRRPAAQLAARRRSARLAHEPATVAGRTRTDHDRAGADRRARRATRPARRRAARLRQAPARLPRADAPLRHRAAGGVRDPAELGDTRRFSSSRQSVRFAGLDVTVHESDTKRRAGHLSRQGPPVLRWAAFEAVESAGKPASPDHAYYLELKQRVGANRAALSIARKLLRRAHHTLRELGDDALAPAA